MAEKTAFYLLIGWLETKIFSIKFCGLSYSLHLSHLFRIHLKLDGLEKKYGVKIAHISWLCVMLGRHQNFKLTARNERQEFDK